MRVRLLAPNGSTAFGAEHIPTKAVRPAIVICLIHAADWLSACAERRRQRLALARLCARMLADAGIARADAEREYAKWPWQP
jgi:uncharacterized protein YjiS (DUF1127 family)